MSFAYESSLVVEDFDLAVGRGELVALVGPNGAGKTTLLKLACGLLRTQEGEVRLEGRTLAGWRQGQLARQIAFLPQQLSVPFPYLVREVVALGRTPHLGWWAEESARDHAAVHRALGLCDLHGLAERPYDSLSAGERQRAALAMAIAQAPRILLLDEPTAHLDIRYRSEVLVLIRRLAREEGWAILAAVHELEWAARLGGRVVVMAQGRRMADGPPWEALRAETVRQAYGVEVDVMAAPDGLPIVVPRMEALRR